MTIWITVTLEVEVDPACEPDESPEWTVVSPDGEHRLDGATMERLAPGTEREVRATVAEAGVDIGEWDGPPADRSAVDRLLRAGED